MSKVGQMSRDRVRFFLHYRYYDGKMGSVMKRAFGIDFITFQELRGVNEGGFWITCRPSQFARFMIYRDEAGIVNGFKDLNASIIKREQEITVAEHIAKEQRINVACVTRILDRVGVDPAEIHKPCTPSSDQIEVWRNPYVG